MAKGDKKKNKSQAKIKQVIRAAGPTISKGEMKGIVKAAGGNVSKALNRISSVQASMKDKGQTAPSIGSGAANQLIKQASSPVGRSSLGNSSIAQAIRSMAGRPAGPMIQGQQTPAIPGTRITTGEVLRPSGRPGTRQKLPRTVTQVVESPYTGPTQEDIDAQIATGVQQGIDDYLASFGGDMYGQDQGYLDMIAQMGDMFASQMGAYQQQMAGQMDLLNQFAMPQYQEPMRMYGAGQNYNIDAIRAAQRDQKRRTGYLRGMGISGGTSGAPALSSGMSIGSALTTPGGVSI
ncbi:hypothetical protein S-CBP4_0022 [Synechococcus phage S-CBP4]|uniref:Uncharacterized protein n=1 Tax=Synechococcus phage S-CBP4 TaxID=754059 RepID=M1NXU0_9CAUD|nr:hypothetical protein S-CBP4_0022 [Synechococcus phage S-CBP4]YP_009822216.1 hypothetical protein HOV40_gp33 [Synechococcus phage S-CBP4]AGF91716.1 hypothetical protein SVPG_00033 [Synechococcus phage S-CBP4]AGK86629.1 hypothetical protein S-CBP4_0022 [Synechococcus phage S-CBP4]